MRNNSSRAGLHRYKRNLLFPFFALIFALPNLIGCTQVLPIEEGKQEINGSVKDWAAYTGFSSCSNLQGL